MFKPYKKLQDSKSDHMSGSQACRPLVHQFKTATKLGDFQEPDEFDCVINGPSIRLNLEVSCHRHIAKSKNNK